MRLHCTLRTLVLAAIGATMLLTPAYGKTLKVGGTGAVFALLNQMAPAFKDETGITLQVVPGLGTSGANNAVADGKLGLAIAGRDLRDKEIAKGLKVAATVRTPIGFATSRPAPEGLRSADIPRLYRADNPVWPDGTAILITLRPPDESDYVFFTRLFPGLAEALAHLRKRPDISLAATDQDNADAAESVKGSLVTATLTQILVEKRNLRFVPIDGVAATLENYLNGSYPFAKTLYAVVPSAISPEAEAFVAFLARPTGAALLRAAAIVPDK